MTGASKVHKRRGRAQQGGPRVRCRAPPLSVAPSLRKKNETYPPPRSPHAPFTPPPPPSSTPFCLARALSPPPPRADDDERNLLLLPCRFRYAVDDVRDHPTQRRGARAGGEESAREGRRPQPSRTSCARGATHRDIPAGASLPSPPNLHPPITPLSLFFFCSPVFARVPLPSLLPATRFASALSLMLS